MDINELESFKLSDAVKFNNTLNPRLWGRDEQLLPEVREKLMAIADDFREFLGINGLDIKDITLSGSNAAYTYTPHSDVDLHLVVAMPKGENGDVYRELFDAKKYQYNDQHNYKIGGYDVELYVQDADKEHHSQGIYSVMNDGWVSVPRRRHADIDDISVRSKFEDIGHRIEQAIASGDPDQMAAIARKVKDMRQAGLDSTGEFGPENLAFKALRTQGLLDQLRTARNAVKDQELSIDEQRQEKKPKRWGEFGGMWFPGFGYYTSTQAENPESFDDGVETVAEQKDIKQVLKPFVDSCVEYLGIEQTPRIILKRDPEWTRRNGTFGRFDPETYSVTLAVSGRHVLDILRTLAHELTHARQDEQAEMPVDAGETGSPYEDEANAMAGRIMRHWVDKHPEFFKDIPLEEDYDPNGPPPGPETKPTMPAGTVKVDVSDVYDWYKLGQHISNLKGLGQHDFGAGPPSAIMAFGSEKEEHKYIKDLEKTGLTTTDIDPVDKNQPSGMPRQKTDPTYNVNEDIQGVDEAQMSKNIQPILVKKGYTFLGKGQDQDAYLAPDGTVLKIFGYGGAGKLSKGQQSFKDFADYCMARPNNPFLPQFGGWEPFDFEGKRYLQIKCERMFDLGKSGLIMVGARLGQLASLIDIFGADSGVKKFLQRYNDEETGKLISLIGGRQQLMLLATTIEQLSTIAIKKGYRFDLHAGNFMIGSDGEIVINDPFFTGNWRFDESVNEAFDRPYKLKWEKGDHGDVDAIAKLDDGNYLSIMFNKGYSQGTKEEAWSVEFFRNNSQEVTGEGDAQRVFATVLSAIQIFIKKYKPNRIIFSASKEVEPGQNAQSRARLYDSLVQRYAKAWGFRAFRADTGNKVIYELDRINKTVAEDFGDEEAMGRIEPYGGIYIFLEEDGDEVFVQAMYKPAADGSTEMGHVLFVQEGDYLMPQDLEVEEKYQGQGIAATMYDYVKSKGYKIRRSGQQTDAGAGFWDKHRPEQNVWEARTNPELNVKPESGMKELASIAKTINDPENWAISMTSEPKLGINPQVGISEDTPKGIYFYPLNYALDKTRYGQLPWGDNYPYIQLFQYDRSGEMTKQTKVDPVKLKKALLQYCPEEVIQQAIDDPEYDGTPYWFIYDCLSRLGQSDETNVVRWNKVLRDLGFTSVYDDGDGWIAYNEPTQGVILDPRVIKQHKTITNKKQSGVVTPAVIERAIFETMDMELASNRAWQAYDPDGSKLRQAAKEYAKDPRFKQYYGKPGSEEIFDKAEGMGRYGARQLSDIAYEWYKAQKAQNTVNEASGYIPSEKEKNDPRFKTALTVDVKPGEVQRQARKMGWKTDPAGRPPLLTSNAKNLKESQDSNMKISHILKETTLGGFPVKVLHIQDQGVNEFAPPGGDDREPNKGVAEEQVDENLRDWFKEKWVRFGPDGKIRGDCARGDDSEGKPKCLPQSKAHSLGKKGRASAASRKRREDPNPERSGKAINVNTKKKSNESVVIRRDEGNFVGDTPANLGGVVVKNLGIGDIVSYLGQKAKIVAMSKTGNTSRITIPSSMGGVTKDVLTKDLKRTSLSEEELEEACWKGYHKEGNKKMFGKTYPNCVKNTNEEQEIEEKWSQKYKSSINCSNPKGFSQKAHCAGRKKNEDILESISIDPATVRSIQHHLNKKYNANLDIDGVLGPLTIKSIKKFMPKSAKKQAPNPSLSTAVQGKLVKEQTQQCPECGGPMFSEMLMNEKKDACYYKVKSRYKVWPSAYASGALVQCRKKGASNWGSKSTANESVEPVTDTIHRVGITVTDPNHPMVSKRNEKYFKTIRIMGGTPEQAVKRAVSHYRKKGYQVHDHVYKGIAEPIAEAIKLNPPQRTIPRDELQGYADRIKSGTKTKRDKFAPIIHGSNIKAITKDDEGTEWDLDDLAQQITTRPRAILGTNAKMEKSKTEGEIIYDLTLPALSGIVVDEDTGDFVEITTCPGAGACQLFCYARKGGYVMFPASSMSAAQALNFLVNDPQGYSARVNQEIKTIKAKTDKAGVQLVVRWHDAGDFFSKEYLDLAYDVARANPNVQFYAYTKMGDVATGAAPANFTMNFSSGSKRGEEKKVELYKQQNPGATVKQGVTVPKDMFFDLIARKGNSLIKDAKGRTQFASPAALDTFKQRLAQQYQVSPDSIITYDQMLATPVGPEPKWNVIVQPGAGDRAANRKDVIDSYLMFH